jgi:hypothetical protein
MADTAAQKAAQRAQIGVELPDPPEPQEQAFEPPEPDRPEWLPEKFKDGSEFAKSYAELETELRTRAESQKALEQRLDAMQATMEAFEAPQQQLQPQPVAEVQQQLMQAFESDPVGTMIFLANAAAQETLSQYTAQQQPQQYQAQQMQGELMADNASRLLETRYPDWREYEQQVGSMIEQNPNLLPEEVLGSLEGTASALEAVYKQAKYEDLVAQLEQQRTGVESGQMKRQAQTVTGASGRAPEPSDVDIKMAELLAATKGASYSAFRGR